ncbi:beta-ketoacyl synthase N-terminal-like domain-containing protein [Micromonospora sp. NPDC049891]|uniref:beta-ketoacyl synthase N-terminal-like domain-containing protein n=1 Tax=Micromonospora sp. NPDC049891 TaxID=3155655 RepID=UPI0033F6120F
MLTATLTLRAWGAHLPESDQAACRPDAAAGLLGRKGLLSRDDATRLALCAVHRTLGLDAGERPRGDALAEVAVVACGNLGNVDTVADLARIATNDGVRAVSPLAAPNASSNVIASVIAIWFRFAGPNLMICSGATASYDALAAAALLLRAGRARRVVVVGAEAATGTATALYGRRLTSGAACVIVESGPGGVQVRLNGRVPAPAATAPWGDCYGAQGLVGVALAADRVIESRLPVEVSCGDEVDGYRSLTVHPAPAGTR